MSAKGGSNTVLGDIGEFLTDASWTLGTAGLLRKNHDTDQIEGGYVAKALDEGVGELTGRNMMREQLNRADAQLEEEKKARAQAKADADAANFASDVSASTAAQATRMKGVRRGGGGSNMTWKSPDETDFLGL